MYQTYTLSVAILWNDPENDNVGKSKFKNSNQNVLFFFLITAIVEIAMK